VIAIQVEPQIEMQIRYSAVLELNAAARAWIGRDCSR